MFIRSSTNCVIVRVAEQGHLSAHTFLQQRLVFNLFAKGWFVYFMSFFMRTNSLSCLKGKSCAIIALAFSINDDVLNNLLPLDIVFLNVHTD